MANPMSVPQGHSPKITPLRRITPSPQQTPSPSPKAPEPEPVRVKADLPITPAIETAFRPTRPTITTPPTTRGPLPPLEESWDEQPPHEEAFLFKAPPPQVDDLVSERSVLRSGSQVGTSNVAPLGSYDIQERQGIEKLELPESSLTQQERQQLLEWLGAERLQQLDSEISDLYQGVTDQVGENEDIATDCYNQLLKARDIVLRRDAARIPQAEYYIEQVQARLKRAAESKRGAHKYAWLITVWGFLWGFIYLALLILLNHRWFHDLIAPVGLEPVVGSLDIFLRAMVWGGIGGVVAVLYSLFRHVSQRDFDPQYNLTYVAKPFLGLVLGATVYMGFQLLLTLSLLPSGLQADSGTLTTVTPWIVYPLAWASGFKENRIFDLLDRAIKGIFGKSES